MNNIIKLLMEKGMTEMEATALFLKAQRYMRKRAALGEEPFDICKGWLDIDSEHLKDLQ